MSKTAVTEILDWLMNVERMASLLYARAARRYSGAPVFSAFLAELAEEEQEHLLFLRGARRQAPPAGLEELPLLLDPETRRRIEAPLVRAQELLEREELTKETLAALIAEAEFSEWNDLFLYVMDGFKGLDRTFQKAVAEVDRHRIFIRRFLQGLPNCAEALDRVSRLAPLCERQILVVEDEPAIANLLRAIVRPEGEVTIAGNGEEGLRLLRDRHFDVVLSDLEMPRMDGRVMYEQAVESHPELQQRFIFLSGTSDPDLLAFLKSNPVRHIKKPFKFSDITEAIETSIRGSGEGGITL